ncbi:MAG TPA: hypothetical protein VKY37_05210 [Brumimicrobium sp.]|nr:hypothetical protein [Brumimicrobium sp.]
MFELAIVSIYLWIGFVCAISFMEAWLKFRAPGVNLEIGLSIGQLVFTALNRVEWALSIVLGVVLVINFEQIPTYFWVIVICPILLLFIQSSYLLPSLKRSAKNKIEGKSTQKSSIHIYYVIFELIKVVLLANIGYTLFKF